MEIVERLIGPNALYHGSITALWLYVSFEIVRRWGRIDPAMRGALLAWWMAGLVLVWIRLGGAFPASGHAIWVWPLLLLTVHLELPSWSRAAALAVLLFVIVFKVRYGRVPSLLYGSAIGLPVAALLKAFRPYGRP